MKAVALVILLSLLSTAFADLPATIPEIVVSPIEMRPMELNIRLPQLDDVGSKLNRKSALFVGVGCLLLGSAGLMQNTNYGALSGCIFLWQATIRFGEATR